MKRGKRLLSVVCRPCLISTREKERATGGRESGGAKEGGE